LTLLLKSSGQIFVFNGKVASSSPVSRLATPALGTYFLARLGNAAVEVLERMAVNQLLVRLNPSAAAEVLVQHRPLSASERSSRQSLSTVKATPYLVLGVDGKTQSRSSTFSGRSTVGRAIDDNSVEFVNLVDF
jgi:hypothetical protein